MCALIFSTLNNSQRLENWRCCTRFMKHVTHFPYFQLFSFYISQSNKGEVTFQKAIREMSEKNFGNIVYISALMMMI